MKTIDVSQLRSELDAHLAYAAREDVVVTQHGLPWVVIGPASPDADLAASPEFWEMIAQRRAEPGLSWEEAKAEMERD